MECQYAEIFGKPGEGVHAHRILGMATVDLSLTIMAAMLIALYWKLNAFMVFIGLMLLGIMMHWWFCVPTALNRGLGLV